MMGRVPFHIASLLWGVDAGPEASEALVCGQIEDRRDELPWRIRVRTEGEVGVVPRQYCSRPDPDRSIALVLLERLLPVVIDAGQASRELCRHPPEEFLRVDPALEC